MKGTWKTLVDRGNLSMTTGAFGAFGVTALAVVTSSFHLPALHLVLTVFYHHLLRYLLHRESPTFEAVLSESKNKELTRDKVELMASRKWNAVFSWIAFHPEELLYVDKRNQNALHHACLFRAPAQVIEMILLEAPGAAGVQNVDGEIPLHWAVRLSAPQEVISLLLKANPSSGVLVRDNDGNMPLSFIWERHHEGFLRAWWQGSTELTSLPAWKRVMLFMRYYHLYITGEKDIDDMADFRELHAAARCPSPPGVFPLILHSVREQLTVKDKQGRMPLAIACSDPLSNRSCGVVTKVNLLLAEAPETAKECDNDGRLPLAHALESGICWEEGIEKLLGMDPNGLEYKDPISGLPPFLLAAVGARNRHARLHQTLQWAEYKDEIEQQRSLSTIFSLLRGHPSQLYIYP